MFPNDFIAIALLPALTKLVKAISPYSSNPKLYVCIYQFAFTLCTMPLSKWCAKAGAGHWHTPTSGNVASCAMDINPVAHEASFSMT